MAHSCECHPSYIQVSTILLLVLAGTESRQAAADDLPACAMAHRHFKKDKPHGLFKTLGVNAKTNEKQIKRNYKKLAMKCHPDRNKDPKADDYFASIGVAYETLTDDKERQKYQANGYRMENAGGKGGGGGHPFGGGGFPGGGFGFGGGGFGGKGGNGGKGGGRRPQPSENVVGKKVSTKDFGLTLAAFYEHIGVKKAHVEIVSLAKKHEMNPAALFSKLKKKYPDHASLLTGPKMMIHKAQKMISTLKKYYHRVARGKKTEKDIRLTVRSHLFKQTQLYDKLYTKYKSKVE